MTINWSEYRTDAFFDELITPKGRARTGAGNLCRVLSQLSDEEIAERKRQEQELLAEQEREDEAYP